MEIDRWNPGTDLARWRDEVSRLLDWTMGRVRGGLPFVPYVDLYQTDDAVVAEVELPGADPRQVDVMVTEDSVTLRGTLREEGERREGGYLYRERRQGSFHRQLALPVTVKAEAARASYQHGVLRVIMPKSEEARRRARRVPIEGLEQG